MTETDIKQNDDNMEDGAVAGTADASMMASARNPIRRIAFIGSA